MTNTQPNILLVGYGNMGKAMLNGWIKQGIAPQHITILDPAPNTSPPADITVLNSSNDLSSTPDIIILAVKPQILGNVMKDYVHFDKALFISIAAGKPLAFLEKTLGTNKSIIRTMPNLPALINKGITAAYSNSNCTDIQRDQTNQLLNAIGNTVWLENETQMDAVTALSGSGPAYVFYLMECFVKAGVEAGLPKELSLSLVQHTFDGAVNLTINNEHDLTSLRTQVTSPGGTTEAGLNILMAKDTPPLQKKISNTVSAAKKRAKELAG